jgi:hypothetical protein
MGFNSAFKGLICISSVLEERTYLCSIGGMLIDEGKSNNLERNVSHCHFMQYNFHMDCLGLKFGLHKEKPVTKHLNCDKIAVS